MIGPCMCGDPYCPSCGPAQGYDPDSLALENEVDAALTALPGSKEPHWAWDELIDRIINNGLKQLDYEVFIDELTSIIRDSREEA